MKKLTFILLTLLISLWAGAQESPKSQEAQEKKVFRGFDGGMMIHTGYLRGTIQPLGYEASGAPFGIGGVARVHLWDHFRVGGEGYLSVLPQKGNGSYYQAGWGGLVVDGYWTLGWWMPYIGLTLGGGAATTLLMNETPAEPGAPVNNTIFHRQGFMVIDPFVGCDFIVSPAFHVTLKVDCLHTLVKGRQSLPMGPRVYLGFLFYRW